MTDNEQRPKGHEPTSVAQDAGGERALPWGVLRGSGVSGVLFGVTGEERRQFILGFVAVAVLVAISNTNNVITILHDLPQWGPYAPMIWEGSSAISLLVSLWIPWLALRLAPPDQPPFWRVPMIHLPAVLLFSLLHVGFFVVLRQAAYLAMGSHYGYAPLTEDFPYELRKDALSYIIVTAIFWGIGRLRRHNSATRQSEAQTVPSVYDIRDGARLTRVRIDQILAVTSADNYVEFVLGDGRRLLTRKSLAAVESELAAHGFLRTHRSWLVNAARMTALKPEGSGDYTVELGTLGVPLSRRFPEALAKLRAG